MSMLLEVSSFELASRRIVEQEETTQSQIDNEVDEEIELYDALNEALSNSQLDLKFIIL